MLLAALAAWLALRPPRRAATRHLLCLAALTAGVLLPAAPRWVVTVPRPRQGARAPAVRFDPAPPPPDRLEDPPEGAGFAADPVAPAPPPVPVAARPRRDPPTAVAPWRLAALAAAGAWAGVVLALLARLAGGRLRPASLKGEAIALGGESRRLLDDCRGALGVARPVGLAVHPAVGSPVVVGGLRPAGLVPPTGRAGPRPAAAPASSTS